MIYNKITVYTNIYNMYGGLVMSDYIISCCSTADLTEEHFNKRDIHIIYASIMSWTEQLIWMI